MVHVAMPLLFNTFGVLKIINQYKVHVSFLIAGPALTISAKLRNYLEKRVLQK